MKIAHQQAVEILCPYAMPHDLARLYYGRLLWCKERTSAPMLRHWTDERHPYRDRFLETWRPVVEEVLMADPAQDFELDSRLKARGLSLRVVVVFLGLTVAVLALLLLTGRFRFACPGCRQKHTHVLWSRSGRTAELMCEQCGIFRETGPFKLKLKLKLKLEPRTAVAQILRVADTDGGISQ